MSVHIIIDGYNLIRQSRVLSELDRQDLQTARDALIASLAHYKRTKPHKITVVFDGVNAPAEASNRNRHRGIDIRFSSKGETADSVIKRMARRERERALVVTSDQEIVHFASFQGAATISSPLFEERVAMAAVGQSGPNGEEDLTGWVPSTKKKGPSRRLSKRQRRNLTKTRKL
jgi:predicted RNA-binding protein with PIN domain